ncbi:FUSC family protein [[Mycobacterium] burgundiense]|uniref:FUSC family protein n=1 Tax=[Mycobacterium] burgundiense TaxID=3064286 RepID=A0ABM9M504_9MYCO|nr:FUSC family protein [Mycolicibacterium sp. MU0053]CAJ1510216.1 FUSC family protein [Mycolicibacterium sp. MU0053]
MLRYARMLRRRLRDRFESRDPERDALRRAARAGLVIPIAAAVGFAVGGGQTPMYAIFGSIALLITVDFPGNRAGRAVSYAGLGLIGAALITLGTLIADLPWLSVVVMFVLGVLVTFAGVLSTAIAAGQRATLMTFVLPACTPTGPVSDRLLGWCIALAVCVPAALFVFAPRHHDDLRRYAAHVCATLADRLEGRATAKDVNAAMNALFAHYLDGDFRPVGLTAGSRALVRVVDDLGWLTDRVRADTAETLGLMSEPSVRVLRACDRLLRITRVPDRDAGRVELDEALADLRSVARGRYREDVAKVLRSDCDDSAIKVGARLLARRTFGATVMTTGRVIAGAAAADARPVLMRVLGRQLPETGAAVRVLSETQAVATIPSGYVATRAVVVRNSIRTGLGLAAAVATTHMFAVEHGFWVVLAALSVLRSTALTTGTKVFRAVSGTVVGFVIGAVLIELLGVEPAVLLVALPVVAFIAAYVPEIASFAAGQAAFTMLVLIVFNLINPSGWQVGLIRIEDIVVGGAVGLVVSLLLWPRGSGRAVSAAIDAAYDVGTRYLRTAVSRVTHGTSAAAVDELSHQALTASRTVDSAVRQYLSDNGGPRDHRAPVIRRANRAIRLRGAADLIADIPTLPSRGAYPNARTVLDAHATLVADRMSGRTDHPLGSSGLSEHFVTALRAESHEAQHPVADALPLVTVAASLGELQLLYPAKA